jgi:hypothetical protein
MIGSKRLLWKLTISLIPSDAGSWKPSCHSLGWFAKALEAVNRNRVIYKIFFIFLPYIDRLLKKYTLLLATKYQLIA